MSCKCCFNTFAREFLTCINVYTARGKDANDEEFLKVDVVVLVWKREKVMLFLSFPLSLYLRRNRWLRCFFARSLSHGRFQGGNIH